MSEVKSISTQTELDKTDLIPANTEVFIMEYLELNHNIDIYGKLTLYEGLKNHKDCYLFCKGFGRLNIKQGNCQIVGYDASQIEVDGKHQVKARDKCYILARGQTFIDASDQSHIVLLDNCSAIITDNCVLNAYDYAKVIAFGCCSIHCSGNTTIDARDNCYIIATDKSNVTVTHCCRVKSLENTVIKCSGTSVVDILSNKAEIHLEDYSVAFCQVDTKINDKIYVFSNTVSIVNIGNKNLKKKRGDK